jgi:hypothetical protein
MYNYLEDKNLVKLYELLKEAKLYDYFIKNVILDTDTYKKWVEIAKEIQKLNKNEAVERNED